MSIHITHEIQTDICEWAANKRSNIVSRRKLKTCTELYNFDISKLHNTINYVHDIKYSCYGCNKMHKVSHPIYLFSCKKCGDKFQLNRNISRDLTDYVSVVIGARTKIGHQIVVKLLDAGAFVYGTTRYPEEAIKIFSQYDNWPKWSEKLKFIKLDLDTQNIEENIENLISDINSPHVDILINCAAQTIRTREKNKSFVYENHNRYSEPIHVEDDAENSWILKISDINQLELEEVHRINSIAPFIIIKKFIPLLRKSFRESPYIINVHAREGIFNCHKSQFHIHTNMAKASMAMLTKCLVEAKLKTESGNKFKIHGCDPGWISVDEYSKITNPWIVPPLDEKDGAARILYPIFKQIASSSKTRRHFDILTY